MDHQNRPFSQNTSQGPSLIFFTQSRCMHSGSYPKISIPAQLHDIVKFQKQWKKRAKLLISDRCNHMRKVCQTTFFIATGKKKNQKRLINKKVLSNWSWPVFANWRNLYILFLWNQKSQEADMYSYRTYEKKIWDHDFFLAITCVV